MNSTLFILILSAYYSDLVSAGILECSTNSDCLPEEATCENEICECPRGKVLSYDASRCLEVAIGYQALCEEDTQCSWLLGKHYCNKNVCKCQSGYRYFHGKCIQDRKLGESCTKDEECHVSNDLRAMVCSSGVCACSDDYYARGNYDCRPLGREIGDVCALDLDCQFENAYCNNGKCIVSEVEDGDEDVGENGGKHQKVVEAIDETKKEKIALFQIGDDCIINDDCNSIKNSFCSPLTKQCTCKRGYFFDSANGCVGELGVDIGCTQDADCAITPRTCINGACLCPKTHYHSAALDKCYKAALTPQFYCTYSDWCGIMGSKAVCVEVSAIDSICQCPFGTVLNDDNICVDEEADCAPECTQDDECSMVNSICYNGKCQCPANYREEDEICLPNIGGSCDNKTKTCSIENSICDPDQHVCSCMNDYLQESEISCLKKASLEEDCSIYLQCTEMDENSDCYNGKCQCKSGYTMLDKVCRKVRSIGDYCATLSQCHVILGNNVQCRNSKCQCPVNMELTLDGLDCKSKSNNINLYGHYSTLCLFIVTLTTCLLG